MVLWAAGKCYMLLTECVMFTGYLWWRGTHKNMHSHVFMCWLIHLRPQTQKRKLEVLLDVRVRVSVCVLPVQNAEREAPSCEAEAACQCCPSGTDTRGASGPPNRLLGWAGSHTSRDTERGREERKERERNGEMEGGEKEGWREKTAGN